MSEVPLTVPASAAGRRRRWPWVVVVVLAIGGGIALYLRPAGPPRPDKTAPRPVPVVVASVRKGDLAVYQSGLGNVVPQQTATVRSRVDGELVRIAFTEGQMVRAGDLLVEIDPRPYKVLLDQAMAQYARDQSLLRNAQLDLKRYRTLLAEDSIPRQQLDTQEALVQQYEAALRVDQSQIDSARLQLTYSRITAPIGGRLGLRLVDKGNIVHATDTGGLVVITQVEPITVVFAIPEDSLPRVQKLLAQGGGRPTVEAYDREGRTRLSSGELVSVDNQIDPTTGTVKLKAQFSNTDGNLFPSQFVNARLLLEMRTGATLVPSVAVQRTGKGALVYVVARDEDSRKDCPKLEVPKPSTPPAAAAALPGPAAAPASAAATPGSRSDRPREFGIVRARPVVTGPGQGEETSIDSGLAPGETVVVDGADRLRDCSPVELMSTREGAGRGGARGAGGGGSGPGGAAAGSEGGHKAWGSQGGNAEGRPGAGAGGWPGKGGAGGGSGPAGVGGPGAGGVRPEGAGGGHRAWSGSPRGAEGGPPGGGSGRPPAGGKPQDAARPQGQ